MEKLKANAVPLLVVAALVLAGLYGLNRGHRMLLDARREAEAAQLALKNQIVTEQESKKELQANVKDLTEHNGLLKAALEDAMSAAPDAKPTGAAVLKTASIKVEGPKRPPEPEPEKAIDPTAYVKVSECVLQNGDQASVRVDQIELTTKAGNTLITGTAEVWRESPEPRGKFLAGKFQSSLSAVHGLELPSPPRWGGELAVLCTRDGCGPGTGVLLPPVQFLGLRWEARADLFAGPALALGGALGARW